MIGIVVVTYNSAEVIGECLDACQRLSAGPIVVVDNASNDGTVAAVSRRPVTLIANVTNVGFAAAVNQGIAALDTPLVLILNPDVALLGGLNDLESAANDLTVAAVGGRLVDTAGKTQVGFNVRAFPSPAALAFEVLGLNRIWPGNPVNRRYRCALPNDAMSDVDQPAGAFLMVRRSAWQAIGGFDEQFHPVWFEDVDFCRRLKDAGYRIVYQPRAVGRHAGGHSVGMLDWKSRELIWYGSLLRYAAKHYSAAFRFPIALAVAAGSVPRMFAGFTRYRTLAVVTVYSRVVWAAGRHLFQARVETAGVSRPLQVNTQAIEKSVQQ